LLNSLGTEKKIVPPAQVTLPVIKLPEIDDQIIAEEATAAAARVAEQRMIRQGLDAWRAIGKAQSFEAWKIIGAALAVGKAHALKVSGAKQAWGSSYSRAFCDWMRRHHFDSMSKSVRSVAIELHENCAAIEQWRATLSEKDQRGLKHPLSNVRRWRQSLTLNAKPDALAKAEAAWRNFIRCISALSQDQAAPLWQVAHEQAAARLAL
jgi:hypothetical protein